MKKNHVIKLIIEVKKCAEAKVIIEAMLREGFGLTQNVKPLKCYIEVDKGECQCRKGEHDAV